MSLLLSAALWLGGAEFQVTTVKDFAPGSLRAALIAANGNNEHDTIYLPAGAYYLSGKARDNENAGGDLDVNNNNNLTIAGAGKETTIIDAAGSDRVLHILAGKVTLKNLTLRGGKSPLENPSDWISRSENGGAVYNKGQLIIEYCAITGNMCDRANGNSYDGGSGGGIYNEGLVIITSCTFSGNQAADTTTRIYSSNGGDGGAFFNKGVLQITSSLITLNRSGRAGAGRDGGNGGDGGAIYNDKNGVLKIYDSVVSYNSTGDSQFAARYPGRGGNGGGIYSNGFLTLSRCAVVCNSTGNGGEGGADFWERPGSGGCGGGIYLNKDSATIAIQYSTISNNRTGAGGKTYNDEIGGGFGGYGGGIYSDCPAQILYCTIAANTTGAGGENGKTVPPGDLGHGGLGGGVYALQRITLKGCLIGDNTVPADAVAPTRKAQILPNDFSGSLLTNGYNLIEHYTPDTVFTIGANSGTDILNTDPQLNPLAQNNGQTWTHALKTGSPAIDAGNMDSGATDQRGIPRPWDMPGITNVQNGSDIGAYELNSSCSVSGRITLNGAGLAGAMLVFSNNGGTAVSDSTGNYFHPVSAMWTGTITPQKEDYAFSPTQLNILPVNDRVTGKNFTASARSLTIRIASPVNGAAVRGVVPIQAQISEHARKTEYRITGVQFFINNILEFSDSEAPYQYSWDTREKNNGQYWIKVVAANSAGISVQDSISVNISKTPHLQVSPAALYFTQKKGGDELWRAQELIISDAGDWSMDWSITADRDWINTSPSRGRGSAQVWVHTNKQTNPGVHRGVLTISCPGADNSPVKVPVTLSVLAPGEMKPPLGSFDTPSQGASLSGSVAFTGWAVDDRGIDYIAIFRDPLNHEGKDKVVVGCATRVTGARPDIQAMFSTYPENQQAGWGYMMLTNMLPGQGNGSFTFYAIAHDLDGKETILGSRKVTCDNAHAVRPFGAIDSPSPGQTLKQNTYSNSGWVLTPPPDVIPQNGSTITVWVDGKPAGHPTYNLYREDVASLFPGYANSPGAAAFFTLDTRKLANGMHTLAWSAADSSGDVDGVGSRYFQVLGSSYREQNNTESSYAASDDTNATLPGKDFNEPLPWSAHQPLTIRKGFNMNNRTELPAAGNAPHVIELREMTPLEIRLAGNKNTGKNIYRGFMSYHGALSPLPTGSSLEENNGVFCWLPGPGFIGDYDLVFFKKNQLGSWEKILLTVRIRPKF